MTRALRALADGIERTTTRVGTAAAWLYPVLMLVLVANVALRYGFGIGSIELEELQWHLFASAFLLGIAWVCVEDAHVRVDLLHARATPRTRAWIEALGSGLLLLPWSVLLGLGAFDFFWQSWQLGERSEMPSGLPARWVIKGVLCLALVLLAAQALALVIRSSLALFDRSES